MQIKNNKPILSQSNIRPHSHSHKNKMIRTLCTIDTSHIEHKDKKYHSKMNKSKSKNNNIFNNNRLMTIEYDCPIQPKLNNKKESVQRKGQSSSKKQATLKKNNTLKNFYDQAMNSKKKQFGKSKRSSVKKQRIKTDYSCDFFRTLDKNNQKQRPQLFYPFDNQYRYDYYDVVNSLSSENKGQKLFLVKDGNQRLFIMKKSRVGKMKRIYNTEIQIKQRLKNIKSKNVVKLLKHYQEKEYLVMVYENYGCYLSWQNESHSKIIKKILKNEGIAFKYFIKEIAKGINALSSKKIVHGSLSLNNIFMQILQNKNNIRIQGNIKIGNFEYSFNINDREKLLNMPKTIFTPPQVLNYMRFQSGSHFDRELIEYIGSYKSAWFYDVWSLGIILLQLLNGQKLSLQKAMNIDFSESQFDIRLFDDEDDDIYQPNLKQLLEKQKRIVLNYLQKIQLLSIDEELKTLIVRMLSFNPLLRPAPQQIISYL